MKKLALVFSLVFLSSLVILAQQEWFWLNPKPSNGGYSAASFTDANNGILVGAGGRIIRTIDGGETWKFLVNFNTSGLNSVSFSDANNGTAVGSTGNIVRTTDGGDTWTTQISGTTRDLSSVFFTDANNGIAVGNLGTVIRTTDGGNIWTALSISSTSSLFGVYFSDVNNGTIVGSGGLIRRTTDGGSTWVAQSAGTTTGTFRAVHFIDSNIGTIVGSSGLIRRTTDGGLNWTTQTATTTTPFNSVFFTDLNNGYIVGNANLLFKTTDGGNSWASISPSPGYFYPFYSVRFFDANNGFIVGSHIILETNDGGNTWINHFKAVNLTNFGTDIYGVHISDENSFSFINNVAGTNRFFKTTDNGENWFSYFFGDNTGYLNDIYFEDTNYGVVVGSGGRIYSTTNGGNSWNSESSGTTAVLNGLSFSEAKIGTVVGASGTILRTTDSCKTWISQSSGTTSALWGVCFVNDTIGTAVGHNSTILRTTDGGSNWVPQTSPVSSNYFLDVSFTDEYNGIIVGSSGIILRSSDGGANWISSHVGYNLQITAITYIDINNATIVANPMSLGGVPGYILTTTDGGWNWELQNIFRDKLYDIASLNIGNLVAVGVDGSVLRVKYDIISNNSPAYISPTPSCGDVFTVDIGHPLSFTVAAQDADPGDVVSLSVSGLPSGSLMNPVLPTAGNLVSSEFSWTPSLVDLGTYNLTYEITDNQSAPVSCSFTIEVVNNNVVPVFVEPTPICGTTLNAYVGDEFSFTISASDADAGDVLSLISGSLPTGSSMNPLLPLSGNPVSSQFSWIPDLVSVGSHTIIFEVTDNYSDPVTCSFIIEVINNNVAPVFISPTPACDSTLTVDVGSLFSFTITAEDANLGDVVVLSSSSLPVGSNMDPVLPATGNPVSSLFSWTPTSTDIGMHQIVYTVNDIQNYQTVCSLTVEVVDVPPPPQMPCPHSQGYWKNHTGNWPASAVPMLLGTTNNYDELQLQSILKSAVRGDASIILAHQLIAAKLNIANGSPVPTSVANAITDADAAIGTLVIPAGIKSNGSLRTTMISLAAILDDYNNGLLTTDCTQMGKSGTGELEPVTEYALFSNYPNPFNPTTKISWQAPVDGHQSLKVYDVLGNEVAVLVDEFRSAGRYEINFDASGLASGIYIYKLQAGDPSTSSGQSFIATKKMILMK